MEENFFLIHPSTCMSKSFFVCSTTFKFSNHVVFLTPTLNILVPATLFLFYLHNFFSVAIYIIQVHKINFFGAISDKISLHLVQIKHHISKNGAGTAPSNGAILHRLSV